MMKKMLSLLLAAAFALAFASVASASSVSYVEVRGTVISVHGTELLVELSNNPQMLFKTDANTRIIDAQTGAVVSLSNVAAGDSFLAWHEEAATASLPPRSYLHSMLLIKAGAASQFHEFVAGSVEVANNGVSMVNTAGDLILSVPAGTSVQLFSTSGWTQMQPNKILAGARLYAHYTEVAASFPGRATAKAVFVVQNGTGIVSGTPSVPGTPPSTSIPTIPIPGVPATGSIEGTLLSAIFFTAALGGLCVVLSMRRREKGRAE